MIWRSKPAHVVDAERSASAHTLAQATHIMAITWRRRWLALVLSPPECPALDCQAAQQHSQVHEHFTMQMSMQDFDCQPSKLSLSLPGALQAAPRICLLTHWAAQCAVVAVTVPERPTILVTEKLGEPGASACSVGLLSSPLPWVPGDHLCVVLQQKTPHVTKAVP